MSRVSEWVRAHKTHVMVGLFVVCVGILATCDKAQADAYTALGKSQINAHQTMGELGIEYRDWSAGALIIGQGDTKKGEIRDVLYGVHVSRRFYAPKVVVRPYLRLGGAWVEDAHPLVGQYNWRLGVGADITPAVSFEWVHLSSAGLSKTNTGIDYLALILRARF